MSGQPVPVPQHPYSENFFPNFSKPILFQFKGIFQPFWGSWTETEQGNTATQRHSCWAVRASILLPKVPCVKVILQARGLWVTGESAQKVRAESRITYHINHGIPAVLIHSVYSSCKISERDNEKLSGLSLKHTSLLAS